LTLAEGRGRRWLSERSLRLQHLTSREEQEPHVSLFDTPLHDITFDHVVGFCKTFPEGVRVEYKREPANIPKVVSSFANTVGGIWIIGVETDPATNRARLPFTGMSRVPGVEEQIIQSAQTGIYPAVTPAIRILDVLGQADRIVVVVKVPESIEAPHAIENSTRVYVRVASTTSPYDLADIDRIEYLFKRRQEPERRREELIAQAEKRSPLSQGKVRPRERLVIAPVYPRGVLVPLDQLHERASGLTTRPEVDYLTALRRIHGAIISSRRTDPKLNYHFEVNSHGIAFFEILVDPPTLPSGGRDLRFVNLVHLLIFAAAALNQVLALLCVAVTNVIIRYELFGWNAIGFLPEFGPGDRVIDRVATIEHHQCVDDHVAVSAYATLETLPERRIEVWTDLMQQVLWAFDFTNENLQNIVGETLRANRLI